MGRWDLLALLTASHNTSSTKTELFLAASFHPPIQMDVETGLFFHISDASVIFDVSPSKRIRPFRLIIEIPADEKQASSFFHHQWETHYYLLSFPHFSTPRYCWCCCCCCCCCSSVIVVTDGDDAGCSRSITTFTLFKNGERHFIH